MDDIYDLPEDLAECIDEGKNSMTGELINNGLNSCALFDFLSGASKRKMNQASDLAALNYIDDMAVIEEEGEGSPNKRVGEPINNYRTQGEISTMFPRNNISIGAPKSGVKQIGEGKITQSQGKVTDDSSVRNFHNKDMANNETQCKKVLYSVLRSDCDHNREN